MNREDIMTLVERYALAMRLVDRHGNQYGDRDLLTLTHQQIRGSLKALVVSEREACIELVLQGTDEPVQTKTLEILRKERERIAAAIRARGQA